MVVDSYTLNLEPTCSVDTLINICYRGPDGHYLGHICVYIIFYINEAYNAPSTNTTRVTPQKSVDLPVLKFLVPRKEFNLLDTSAAWEFIKKYSTGVRK
jgi:hypothetical protein